MPRQDFEQLRRRARQMQDEGLLPREATDAQKADWAYGNAVIENDDVTFEMAEDAVARRNAAE